MPRQREVGLAQRRGRGVGACATPAPLPAEPCRRCARHGAGRRDETAQRQAGGRGR